jgi:hypothetical protein
MQHPENRAQKAPLEHYLVVRSVGVFAGLGLDKGLMPGWGETTGLCWLNAQHESALSAKAEMAQKRVELVAETKTGSTS